MSCMSYPTGMTGEPSPCHAVTAREDCARASAVLLWTSTLVCGFSLNPINGNLRVTAHLLTALRQSAAQRRETGAPVAMGAPVFDYDALAEASAARPVYMSLDGRTVAQANSRNTALAQNRREREIAMRFGSR